MPRIQSVSPLFTHAGLDEIVSLYRKAVPTFYDQFTNEANTKSYFYRVATEADFLPAAAINEATGVDYQDFDTPFFRDIYHTKRAVGFAVSTEAVESDLYGVIAKRMPKQTRSIVKAMEIDCAGFMNLATSAVTTGPNSTVTPDGLSLANTGHLLANGTFSNILSTSAVLSYTSLALGIQELMVQPSHTGDPGMYIGPYTLHVHPNNADNANRLVKTTKGLPGTNDNDINWAATHVNRIVVNPYLTSTTAWSLCVQGEDNPLIVLNRRKDTFVQQPDIDKDVQKFVLTRIWSKYAKDPRGFLYSPGS